MSRINAGQQMTEWVDAYTTELLEWAIYKLSDDELARDLVQDTFMAAWQNRSSFEGKSNPKTWLLGILNHKIVDHYRRQGSGMAANTVPDELFFFDDKGMWREGHRPRQWDTDKNPLDDAAFAARLDECMDKLPLQWGAAVRLKYMDQQPGADICKELNVSATNYWQILHRAKLSLRQCLEYYWFK